ncbi:B3 domain-containing transcription factor ABI3-like [Forsythia ovata]|uniref:B3 domain-containing transcription factor ABI3-like n=1 Tax=Forsythia ovata TaxID=205694 RepID=A0ABD1VEE1_9LAMI
MGFLFAIVNPIIFGSHVKHPHDVFDRVKGDSNNQSLSIPISSSQYNPYLENGYIPQGIRQHQVVFNRNLIQIFDTNGERLVRLGSSATKEARKKKMARQRRLYLHYHRHRSHHNQHQNQTNFHQDEE